MKPIKRIHRINKKLLLKAILTVLFDQDINNSGWTLKYVSHKSIHVYAPNFMVRVNHDQKIKLSVSVFERVPLPHVRISENSFGRTTLSQAGNNL